MFVFVFVFVFVQKCTIIKIFSFSERKLANATTKLQKKIHICKKNDKKIKKSTLALAYMKKKL